MQRIAIIGFGEAGGILARDFASQGIGVAVFDILLRLKESREAMLSKARECAFRAA
jgi:prephenate dehydrogenase